ncbi:MAG: hypothetical protein V1892_00305 [bacterium]
MRINIFNAESIEWQKINSLYLQAIIVEKGGLLVFFQTRDSQEARILDFFDRKVFARCKIQVKNEDLTSLYSNLDDEFVANSEQTNSVVYHFCDPEGDLTKCFKSAAALIELFGQIFARYKKEVISHGN